MSSFSGDPSSGESALQRNVRTLDQCKKGELLRVDQLVAQAAFGAHDDEVTQRLKELGFLPGTTLTVLGFGFWGRDPISVKACGTKFALRRGEAKKLVVSTVELGA